MNYIKLFFVFLHVLLGCSLSIFFFIISSNLKKNIIKKWSNILLKILKIKIKNKEKLSEYFEYNKFLIFSNHISWLDIIVFNSIQPMTFIAKDDIKKWPFIGFLASQTNTIFINRKKIFDVKNTTNIIQSEFKKNINICIFPEGSSSYGYSLLNFKSNLFQAAINLKKNVLPVCIQYFKNNAFTFSTAYCDDINFIDSIFNIIRSDGVQVVVSILDEISPGNDRKALSKKTYSAIYKKIFSL